MLTIETAAGAALLLMPGRVGGAKTVLGVLAQACCIVYYATPFSVLTKVTGSWSGSLGFMASHRIQPHPYLAQFTVPGPRSLNSEFLDPKT